MNNDLSAGTAISHYRIVSKLGAGGMGEVIWRKMGALIGRSPSNFFLPTFGEPTSPALILNWTALLKI
jgi:hypothetical protein